MSLGDWTSWNDKTTRKRDVIPHDVIAAPEFTRPEPIEVKEDPLSETGIRKFIQRIAGWGR